MLVKKNFSDGRIPEKTIEKITVVMKTIISSISKCITAVFRIRV